jgi:hypothetical protein
MKKKKGYITILLLLLGGFAVAQILKKKKSRVIVDNPEIVPYSKEGSTVYEYDLSTPIYTFKKRMELKILEQDQNLPYTKVSFMANNVLKTGWIGDNNIIKL